ncbi:unnamed protein product [Eruca vesicaria subsp. sativa]|uniref:Uncharacterized protein n=1 Tax=Eruca vesicaria subsp. sativa TaxID=29727 RepID=A0ABC8MAH7_ERUVS|nr:unnamed protein product [Eruca vesicaria subsp. sativa]
MNKTERSPVNTDEAKGSPTGDPENDGAAEDDIAQSSEGVDEVDQTPVIAGGLAAGGEVEWDAIGNGEAGRSSTGSMDVKGKRLPLPLMGKIPRVYLNFSEILDTQLGDANFDPTAALEAENEKAGGSLGKGTDPPAEELIADEVLDRDSDPLPKKKKKKHKSSRRAQVNSAEVKTAGAEVAHEDLPDGARGGSHEVTQVTGSKNLLGENLTGGYQIDPPTMKRKKPIDGDPSDSGGKRDYATSLSQLTLGWIGSANQETPLALLERWDFQHKKDTPFVNDQGACAELSRRIRGGTREMPKIRDLAFLEKFAESARADAVASARKNHLILECELAMRKMAFDLEKAETVIKTKDAELEKTRKSALERVKETAVERNCNQRERNQAIERADGLDEDLENAQTKIAQLEREKVEEAEKHKKLMDFMKQARAGEVISERGRLMAAASTRFNKFRKYMADQDELETKLCFHAQASGTLQSLDVLEKWGLQVPKRMRDTLTVNEKKYKCEVEEVDVEEIIEQDLSLSPPRSGPLKDLDQFGTNMGLVDSATAVSLLSLVVVVGNDTAAPSSHGYVHSSDAKTEGASGGVLMPAAGAEDDVLSGEKAKVVHEGSIEEIEVSAKRSAMVHLIRAFDLSVVVRLCFGLLGILL